MLIIIAVGGAKQGDKNAIFSAKNNTGLHFPLELQVYKK
jgi:hypothetical protein